MEGCVSLAKSIKVKDLFSQVLFLEVLNLLDSKLNVDIKNEKALESITYYFKEISNAEDVNVSPHYHMTFEECEGQLTAKTVDEDGVGYSFSLEKLISIANYTVDVESNIEDSLQVALIIDELIFYGTDKNRQEVFESLKLTSLALENQEYTVEEDDCFCCEIRGELVDKCISCNGTGKLKKIVFDDENLN